MAWVYLTIAGILEIVWASFMKQSDGFTKLWPSVITLVAMIASFWLLAAAMKSLPLGTAYTVWVGIGAIGAFAIGILWLGEPANLPRLIAAGLIVSGIIVMKVSGTP